MSNETRTWWAMVHGLHGHNRPLFLVYIYIYIYICTGACPILENKPEWYNWCPTLTGLMKGSWNTDMLCTTSQQGKQNKIQPSTKHVLACRCRACSPPVHNRMIRQRRPRWQHACMLAGWKPADAVHTSSGKQINGTNRQVKIQLSPPKLLVYRK